VGRPPKDPAERAKRKQEPKRKLERPTYPVSPHSEEECRRLLILAFLEIRPTPAVRADLIACRVWGEVADEADRAEAEASVDGWLEGLADIRAYDVMLAAGHDLAWWKPPLPPPRPRKKGRGRPPGPTTGATIADAVAEICSEHVTEMTETAGALVTDGTWRLSEADPNARADESHVEEYARGDAYALTKKVFRILGITYTPDNALRRIRNREYIRRRDSEYE
jgi:hypothetical protein